MIRVLYVPKTEEITAEINARADELALSILHGESALSRYVDFDRSVVQVISLPSEKMCLYAREVVTGLHQVVEVTNDFTDLRDNVVFVLNGSTRIEPTILEKHFARYVIQTRGLGFQVFDIFDKGMAALEHGEYTIVNPD